MNRGGARPGAGRPRTERTEAITIRVSKESKEWLKYHNASEVIDSLIKQSIYEENLIINNI